MFALIALHRSDAPFLSLGKDMQFLKLALASNDI
jgi:hypothetical protein